MRFLKDASAIIIDIRGNSGGDHSPVRYLVSHFLKADTKLYDFTSTRAPPSQSYALSNLPAGRLNGIPLYLLIDNRTVSAGEDLAYQVEQYHLGDLVGTRTAGAANNNDYFAIGGKFRLSLSVGRPVHPVSHSNWEGVGIAPTIAAPTGNALDRALILAAERLSANATPMARAELQWTIEEAQTRLKPIKYTAAQLAKYTGQYDDYAVTLSGDTLWLKAGDREALAMHPSHQSGLFLLEGRDFIRAQFRANALDMLALGAPEPLTLQRTSGR